MNINTISYSLDRSADKSVELDKKITLEAEKKRLFKAAKDMESLFLFQVLKAMRDAIPKGDEENGLGMGGGLGKDIYTQMFDQELAANMAGVSDKSIAGVIYRSMERAVENRFNSAEGADAVDKTILPQQRHIQIKYESPPVISQDKIKPSSASKANQTGFDNLIDKIARKHNLNPDLVKSVVMAESGGDSRAVSPAGAKGLMQLTDTTAAEMGVKDVFNPRENIEGGTKYLRQMIDRFGDIEKALAAYNAGPARVEKYNGIPPFPETQNYIRTVIDTAGSKQIFYE